MELGQLLLGQIPEALYFAIFMIFVKQLKEKRILFTLITIIEYALLFNLFKDSYISHIIFFIFTYCLLKILYNESIQNIVNMCINSNVTNTRTTYKNLSISNLNGPLYNTKFNNSYYSNRLSELTAAGWTY